MKFRRYAVVIATALVAAIIASCALAGVAASSHTSASTIRITGGEFFFKPNMPSARRGKITLVFKNVGHVAHDLRIAGKQTPMIAPGKTATLVLRLMKPGNYPFVCTVPGHAQAGMRGRLKIT